MLWNDPFAPLLAPFERAAVFVPAADVAVGDGDVVLTMDLPGVRADDLEIELLDGYLTVRGERKRPEVGENTTWAHAERSFGAFERRIRLPDNIDADAITASMDHGVLSLIVPKPQKLRRTIAVGGGQKALETATA